jgi:hypothetical protein
MKDDTDIKYLANKEYPASDNRLNYWDHNTQNVMGFCFPSTEDLKDTAETIANAIYASLDESVGGFTKYMVDLQESWQLILLMGFMSFIITLIYMFLLKWITKPVLYVSLFLIFIFGALTALWCA